MLASTTTSHSVLSDRLEKNMYAQTARATPRSIVGVLGSVVVTVLLLLGLVGAPAAHAASPGWSVVGVTGPTNLPPAANEVQKIAVDAHGGSFTLSFRGQTTSALASNATASQVAAALNGLSTIGGADGSASVTGGPGGPGATHPYRVTFGGDLAGSDVPAITADSGALLIGAPQTLTCDGGPAGTTRHYQWLHNGSAIPGATDATYQTATGDAGAAVQCQVTALSANSGSVQTSTPLMVAPPTGSGPPKPPTAGLAAPRSSGFFGLLTAGDTLTCDPNAAGWSGSPTFAYRWFVNGVEIPGATASTYVTQAADFPGAFQCAAIGADGGGQAVAVSAVVNSTVAPSPAAPTATAAVPGGPSVAVTTETEGGSTGKLAIFATNIGGATTSGTTTVTAVLPDGITPNAAPGCTVAGQTVTCITTVALGPGLTLPTIMLDVSVDPGASGTRTAKITVSGGGAAAPTSYDEPITISPVPARAGVQAFTAAAHDSDGNLETQAGSHPYSATTAFFVNTIQTTAGGLVPAGDPRDIKVELPPGFLGNPLATPRCPLANVASPRFDCDADTYVGVVTPLLQTFGRAGGQGVVNNVPPIGSPAQFTFNAIALNISVDGSLRSDSDYGITVISRNTPQFYNVYGAIFTFWGVPADPSHDGQRCLVQTSTGCATPASSAAPRTAFLTNPTDCPAEALTPPSATLRLNSWQDSGIFDSSTVPLPAVVGCDRLPFAPSADLTPTTTGPDAPTGLNVDIGFPQAGLLDPDGLATASLKKAVVALPNGLTISPTAATGLQACSDAQLNLKSLDPVHCPEAAKIGTATATTPLLDESLTGGVYMRAQNSMDPESGEMFRIALVLENKDLGISVRLPGAIRADAQTGQLTATFDNNPRLPVDHIKVQFKGGSSAPLATPKACGLHTINAALTSWGGQSASLPSTFTIGCTPGLGWFGPFFSAGTISPVAGSYSPFVLRIDKPDGQSDMNGITLSLPEGLIASLKGNVGRQIGTASVGAGPGPTPFWLSGPVVLEGPYGDAPFSLRVTVPVIAGPFNLGDVVVRQKIYVDPHDAHVTVVSDPLPTIVKGVPVRLQNLRVNIDKAGFMRNPTSCAPKSIGGTLGADTGQTAAVASRFQVGGCKGLPLSPKMAMELKGKKQIKRGKHPTLVTQLTQRPGESNLKSVKVRLPLSLALDPDNAEALCKPAQAAAKACPKASIVGTATAVSPVLNRPLHGDVFFVEGTRKSKQGRTVKTLPKLWVALRGEVAIDLWADSSIEKGKYLVTTFPFVPDAPINAFRLRINGGKHGILAVTGDSGANLCQRRLITDADYEGQNGKQVQAKVHMDSPCGFQVRKTSVSKSHAKVTVSGISAGKLTISGKGIHRTSRTIKHSKVATIRPRLTATGKRLYQGRKVIRLRVSFDPKAKGQKTKHAKTTVKRAKKESSSSTRSHRSPRTR